MAQLQAALPQLAGIPVLLFWGDNDRAVALKSGQELARRLGVPLQVVRDAGHIPFEEQPEICNPVLGEWLAA
jgi:pimeloyl-ACP methyl ester carboxylesterase